jgi:hypothetical protein
MLGAYFRQRSLLTTDGFVRKLYGIAYLILGVLAHQRLNQAPSILFVYPHKIFWLRGREKPIHLRARLY